jgi:hypothetical protein
MKPPPPKKSFESFESFGSFGSFEPFGSNDLCVGFSHNAGRVVDPNLTHARSTGGSAAIMGAGGPHSAPVRDLEVFRQHVLALRSDLVILQQLGQQLASLYGDTAE